MASSQSCTADFHFFYLYLSPFIFFIASSAESVGVFSTEEQHKLSNAACFPGFAYQKSLDISHLQIEKGRLITLQTVSKRSLA
jgi:hypothetical protein